MYFGQNNQGCMKSNCDKVSGFSVSVANDGANHYNLN